MTLTGTGCRVAAAIMHGDRDMASNAGGQPGAGGPWRTVGWGFAVALLLLPFVAVQVGADGVNWSLGDFIVFGIMFGMAMIAAWFLPEYTDKALDEA